MTFTAPLPADFAELLDVLARDAAEDAVSDGLLPFDWPLPRGVRAAFTTRVGGASRAPWDSFNLGVHVGDDPAAVAANRARLRAAARGCRPSRRG